MRGFLLVLPALFLFALAPPARAENWVSFGDPWIWDDLDSVSRSGSLVTWNTQHSYQSGVSPAIGGGGGADRVGVDCSTRQWYNINPDGVFGPDFVVNPTRADYVYFCITTAPSSIAAPAPAASSNPLMTGWSVEDMAAVVRQQLGTTDGVALTDSQGVPYLVARTTAGNQFQIRGSRCLEGSLYCRASFLASILFADEAAAQRFVTNHPRSFAHGLYRTGATVEIGAYLLFDHGITRNNLAMNITTFMLSLDADVVSSRQ